MYDLKNSVTYKVVGANSSMGCIIAVDGTGKKDPPSFVKPDTRDGWRLTQTAISVPPWSNTNFYPLCGANMREEQTWTKKTR